MSFLDTDLLARIHERAADADAANTYPEADLADRARPDTSPRSSPRSSGAPA